MKTKIRIILMTLLYVGLVSIAYADFVVIVNPANAVNSLTVDEVKNIVLGKQKRYANGNSAEALDNASLKELFYKQVTEKNLKQVRAYWARLIFTGKGKPPLEVESDEEVKKWIISNKDGFGYIDSKLVDDSVKVVLTVTE
ncbi:MAG: phosphate ABC transporter substrate-binding protein [SAR324 cluster bacterium]|nr:phosphate ABC transporter substrate-binding protein [SAR324 cluster bacterium]